MQRFSQYVLPFISEEIARIFSHSYQHFATRYRIVVHFGYLRAFEFSYFFRDILYICIGAGEFEKIAFFAPVTLYVLRLFVCSLIIAFKQ